MKKFLLSLILLAPAAFAAEPLFSLVPVGTLPTTVPPGGTATAQYTVTNNAPYTLQGLGLNTLPSSQTPVGVTQNTVGAGVCSDPFSLDPGASCILSLTITADDLQNEAASGGPELCFNVDSPSRCSVPNANARLNVAIGALTLYVTNSLGHTVSKCTVDTNPGPTQGLFSTCVDSGAVLPADPAQIIFQTFNNQTYAYLGVISLAPYRCLLGADGQLSGCGAIPNSGVLTSSYGVAFNSSGGQLYVYVSDGSIGSPVYRCISSADGSTFSGCVDSGAVPATFTEGAAFITFQSFSGNTYSYIANGNVPDPSHSGSVNQYSISSGVLTQVATTPQDNALAVTFTSVGGTEYAYVTRWHFSIVDQCTLNIGNGQLGVCTPVTAAPYNEPIQTFMTTINGTQYAYVSDGLGNKVWVCTLNPSSGDFSSCVNSGFGGFNYPAGIAMP